MRDWVWQLRRLGPSPLEEQTNISNQTGGEEEEGQRGEEEKEKMMLMYLILELN